MYWKKEWKKVGYFAHCEIWSKGEKRVLFNPKTDVVEFEYVVTNQLKIPFEKGDGDER